MILFISKDYFAGQINNESKNDEKQEQNSNPDIHEKDIPLIESETMSHLEGREVQADEEKVVAAIIENHSQSRPQMSGLNQASVVFETEAEGGITRFLALYPYQNTEKVGPIRSARPYFVSWAIPFKSAFAHAGGSTAALKYIYSSEDILDIDGLYWEEFEDYFIRDLRYYAPHNLFANLENLRELMDEKEWDEPIEDDFFEFGENDGVESFDAEEININYPFPLYYVQYEYDQEDQVYYRSQGHTPQIDKLDDSQIFTDNVVVMFTDYYPIDNEGRLAMTVNGNGKMYLFTKGRGYEGVWEKLSESDPIVFYNEDEEILNLSPGKTWISVINYENAVSWE